MRGHRIIPVKQVFTILFLLCALPAFAAQMPTQDNKTLTLFGDSWKIDGTSTSPQTGNMFDAYVGAAEYLAHPEFTNVMVFPIPRAGGNMSDQATAAAQDALAVWAFNSIWGITATNIAVAQATENGADNSSQMFLQASNNFQAPLVLTNGTGNTNDPGYAASVKVAWWGLGSLPGNAADGGGTASQSHFGQNNGMTNAAGTFGVGAIDSFGLLIRSWTNDIVAHGGTNINFYTASGKENHPGPPGQRSWFFAYVRATTTDTNVSSCTLDFRNATVAATNHCNVTNATLSGNTLTFPYRSLSLPPAWDRAGSVDLSGFTLTNEAWPDLAQLDTNDCNLYQQIIQVTNLPAGNYRVQINGVTVADNLPSSVLANGWNMFTNMTGPMWQQRIEVLGRMRDVLGANRTNLISGSTGVRGYTIYAFDKWQAGYRGDALITNAGPSVDPSLINYIWGLKTNATASFAAVRAAAQPVTYTITISLLNQVNVGTLNVFAKLLPRLDKNGRPMVGQWDIEYAPGFNPTNFNWYARVSPDLVHWTMWGQGALDDTDDITYRPPAGGRAYAYLVGYPKPQGQPGGGQ
jgi:hypothetical protein